MKLENILSVIANSSKVRYEPWSLTDNGYTNGRPSWVIYDNNLPVAALSNDSDDQSNIVIRHIESLKKGFATMLIRSLLDRGFTIKTGRPGYNSISPCAYHLFKKIDRLSKEWGIDSERIGKADNSGKGYKELDDIDVQHFRWKKCK